MGNLVHKQIQTLVPARHHMLAFAGSVNGESSDVTIDAVADSVYSIISNSFVATNNLNIFYAAGLNCDKCRAKITAPSLLDIGYPSIQPLETSSPVFGSVMNFIDYPIPILAEEAFGVQASNTNVGSKNLQFFLGVGQNQTKLDNLPELRWLRATSTTTTSAGVWAIGTMTFDDSLPVGNYDVYGLIGIEVSGVILAARLVFPGQIERPGALVISGESIPPDKIFQGDLGVWGTFASFAPPTIEVFALSSTSVPIDLYILLGKNTL